MYFVMTGLKPVPGTWKTWNIGELESDGSGRDGDTSAAAKKMMEAAALNRKGMSIYRLSSIPALFKKYSYRDPCFQCHSDSLS